MPVVAAEFVQRDLAVAVQVHARELAAEQGVSVGRRLQVAAVSGQGQLEAGAALEFLERQLAVVVGVEPGEARR